MARLDFDFHPRPARPATFSIMLALAGVLALAWAWQQLRTARAAEAGLTAQIAQLQQQARPRPAARPAAADSATQAAQARVAAQLAYTWQPAFDALAAAQSGKIALLALDAAQAKAHIKLTAEARQLADAIEFMNALQQQPGIRRVALTQHELREDDAQKPVRFIVQVELSR